MLDLIVLARCIYDRADAEYCALRLDLSRKGVDRADVYARSMWRAIIPALQGAADSVPARYAAVQGAGWRDAATSARSLPTWLIESAGNTADLVQCMNSGGGTRWRLALAPVTQADTSEAVRDVLPAAFRPANGTRATPSPFATARPTHYARRFA